MRVSLFFYFALRAKGLENKIQGSGGALFAGEGPGDTLIFARLPQGQKCRRVPSGVLRSSAAQQSLSQPR